MDIRTFLGLHSSRLNADILADKMAEDTGVIDTVWDIMLEDTHPVSMRAAWSLGILTEKKPGLMETRVKAAIGVLERIKTESVRRGLLRLLTFLPIPEEDSGFIFDHCFGIIENPVSAISHKAYAMRILYNISEMEPDLKPELITLFESLSEDESSGVKACSINYIKLLEKDVSERIKGIDNRNT